MLNTKPIFILCGVNENGKRFYFSGTSNTIEHARRRIENIRECFSQEIFDQYSTSPSPLKTLQIEEWHQSSIVEEHPYNLTCEEGKRE